MKYLSFLLAVVMMIACQENQKEIAQTNVEFTKGGLFIIGGGSRPSDMIDELIDKSNIKSGHGYILPMASELDSSFYYANLQFQEKGIMQLKDFTTAGSGLIDSIKSASLIYIGGGDQRRLMEALDKEQVKAIKTAFKNGAVIAGTSAGAAVMSNLMITGDEKKHPEYHPTFRTVEKDNIEYDTGLGLLPSHIVIDQHFVYRSRYNRLLTAILQNPNHVGLGIDESTAIFVQGDSAQVIGDWQVLSFKNTAGTTSHQNNLMGAKNIELNIYLPGEKFKLP